MACGGVTRMSIPDSWLGPDPTGRHPKISLENGFWFPVRPDSWPTLLLAIVSPAAGWRTRSTPTVRSTSVVAQCGPENRVAALTDSRLGDGRIPRRAGQRTEPRRTD